VDSHVFNEPRLASLVATATFVRLVNGLVEAMGQRMDAAKTIPEGVLLRTDDGFLHVFLEDPNQVSLDLVRRLYTEEERNPVHVVVLTPGHLPLAITAEILQRSGTVVEGARFAELARQLGLESFLGEEPRPVPAVRPRLLPSAQLLDAVMTRARTWLDWGVPALALRFYRQAAQMKPGFLPARIGLGRALLGLGLVDDADRVFSEILAGRADDLDARLGHAAVLGARSRPKEEIAVYRALLAEDEARVEVRAHLLAALIELGDWAAARVEVEAMLEGTPEDPQLRFLRSVTLLRTGKKEDAEHERVEARKLGLTHERETALCQHLGIAPPPPPEGTETSAGTAAPARKPRRPSTRKTPSKHASSGSASRRTPAPTRPRASVRRPPPRKGK
jgi:thioredoxin-like negative regulator of GroEL